MDEHEIRELCHAFFDAYQDGRVDVLRRILSNDCIIWHNVFGRETTRDENLAAYPNSYAGQRRRTYDDRIVNTFEDGFVIQYSLGGVMHTGHRSSMPICIVARCHDGQITRIDEYMDTSKFAAWMGTEA
jgi:ketosteroid isomerase-like protein